MEQAKWVEHLTTDSEIKGSHQIDAIHWEKIAKKKVALRSPVMATQFVDNSATDLEISGSDPTTDWHQEKMLRISVSEVARDGQ